MRKPNTPKKPFALSIRWQLMLFIGGITLFTLLLGRLLLGRQEKPTTALVAGALSTVLGAVLLACF